MIFLTLHANLDNFSLHFQVVYLVIEYHFHRVSCAESWAIE